MALPADVTTFTLTLGPYTDATGQIHMVGADLSVRPSVRLTHVASGQQILTSPVKATVGEDGTVTIGPLPHTNNPGLSPVGFTYELTFNVAASKQPPPSKRFAVPAEAGTTVDYDLLGAAPNTPGVLVPLGAPKDADIAALLNDTGSATYARVIELIAARAGFGGLSTP